MISLLLQEKYVCSIAAKKLTTKKNPTLAATIEAPMVEAYNTLPMLPEYNVGGLAIFRVTTQWSCSVTLDL
jgi:hypothetical protein